jgi:conjugal transfer pilus assembly protein TraK
MFNRHVGFILAVLLTGFTTNAMALQVKSAHDSQTLLFKISAKEYTRVAVRDDRIVSVKGRSSAFETRQFGSEGGDDGVVYLRAMAGSVRPFSLFIATESGRHYTLMLNVSDLPAENIKIVPVSAVTEKARHWERSSPYTDTIVNLVRAMHTDTPPDGYARINMGRTKPQRMQAGFSARLQTVFRGDHLQGEIWTLQNDSGQTVSNYPQRFMHGNVRAISITDESIPPHGMTRLYRIVDHD